MFGTIKKMILFCFVVSTTTYGATTPQDELIPRKPNFAALPKRCKVTKLSDTPYILCIHNFFTDAESEFLKKSSTPLLKRSMVVDEQSTTSVSEERTSQSAFLNENEAEIVTNIRKRAASFLNKEVQSVEGVQVVHYQHGQKFNPHYDYFDRSLPSGKQSIAIAGQRIATFFGYLNNLSKKTIGGETLFPKIGEGLKIKPKKNMAVFWFNVLPDGKEDELTLHAGLPVDKGQKYGVNIWLTDERLK